LFWQAQPLPNSQVCEPYSLTALVFAFTATCTLTFPFWQAWPLPNSQVCKPYSLTVLVFAFPATSTPTFPFWQAQPLPNSRFASLTVLLPATCIPTFPFWQTHPFPNSQICENEHPDACFRKSEPHCPCCCSPSHPHPDVPVSAGPPITQALLSLGASLLRVVIYTYFDHKKESSLL